MVRIGVIGLGYWGPNLVRNFANIPDSQVTALCDLDSKRLKHSGSRYPHIHMTNNTEEILNREIIDAVVIATPTKTHYSLAKRALEQGLHTFVEKPLATSPAECEDLIRLAQQKGLILFVGHVFLYTAAVTELKKLITNGQLGDLCYISSSRLNLGPIRQDVNALWDLAPHDISIILALVGASPITVNCQGYAYLNQGIHDVCTLEICFENNNWATIHVSWLDPNKRRLMTIVGSKKMAIYDDVEPLEKVKIYNKTIVAPKYSDTFGEFQFSYRYGATYSPWLDEIEPLKAECEHFVDCVQQLKKPRTDGQDGLEVVKVLAAADQSLHNGGGSIEL